ncbi:MAG: hypothetical protein IPN14_14375 [Bacteroidetes bacterium]|nr:hypothetical protein [Bacteroidota bacterium]
MYHKHICQLFFCITSCNTLNLGYWESYNDIVNGSDVGSNAGGGTTIATLKIYYQYVPASFEWYTVAVGGGNLYNLSPSIR